MQNTQTITINDLKAKNRKQVDKNCTSTDFYLGDKFLFNEVECQLKNGKTSSYQYFTNLDLTSKEAFELTRKYNCYMDGDPINMYYIYFCDFNKALEFINSEDFR